MRCGLRRDTSPDLARLRSVQWFQRVMFTIDDLTLGASRAVHRWVNTMHRALLPRPVTLAVPGDRTSLFVAGLAPNATDALRLTHLHVAGLNLAAALWASERSGRV